MVTSSATTSSLPSGGLSNGIHQPKPRKVGISPLAPGHHDALRMPMLLPERTSSGTPGPPDDALPSVKATSAVRKELRRRSKRMFPTVEYQERVSYFDPRSDYSDFRGFFVLFWIGLAIMVITAMLRNLKETGSLLSFKQWETLTANIWELAFIDLVMVASTAINLPLHLTYKRSKGWLRWDQGGMIVQSVVQAVWLWIWVSYPFARDWSWTAQVFFILHTLAILMKMHSHAFYCGHLSTTLCRLQELDQSQDLGPRTPTPAKHYPQTPTAEKIQFITDEDDHNDLDKSTNISPIVQLREDLAKELTSPLGNITYPSNITVGNYVDYLLCPTLCYELEYPRTSSRNYLELFYKVLAVFGCIFLLTVTSEEFIIPVLDESHVRLQETPNLGEKALIFAETVSRMLFPFMVTFLLVFLVIFEYVLGAFAEITCFGDRKFYSDWWNSLDWLEFSREWNIPVHNFFRRHVYSASREAKLSKGMSMGITFFISAIAHELVMGCITRKFRGYGFILMMLQMPFVMIQRMPWIRDRKLLNNVMFWICMIMGLSLLCALYVLV